MKPNFLERSTEEQFHNDFCGFYNTIVRKRNKKPKSKVLKLKN